MPTKPTTAASRPDSRLVKEIRTLVENSSDDAIWSIGAAALARVKELLVSGPFGLVPNASTDSGPLLPELVTNVAPAGGGRAGNAVAAAFAANRAKHAGEFAGYSINAIMADADPALAHLDSIGRRMVGELRANNIEVPDLRNEVAIFNAYTEMLSAGAREQLATAETKLRYLRHLGGGQGA